MRIAYVLVWRDGGAASGVLRKVRSQVLSWLSLGHDARLLMISQDTTPWPPLEDVPLTLVHSSALWARPFAAERVRRQVLKWSPDLVYLRQATYYPAWERLMAAVPTVVEANTDDLAEVAIGVGGIRAHYHHLTRSRLLRHAAGYACVTRGLAESYASLGKLTIAIGNGVDLSAYTPQPPEHKGRPRLVFLGSPEPSGRCQPWQGVDKVLRLAQRLPDIAFDVVGPNLSATGMPVSANVTTHGLLDRPAYDAILAGATAGLGTLALHRKRMNEASPLKVREYLAFGLPVILGYVDTDLCGTRPYVLQIPNTESNVETCADAIERFAHAWQGRRVSRPGITHLDHLHKERERLAFFESVLTRG